MYHICTVWTLLNHSGGILWRSGHVVHGSQLFNSDWPSVDSGMINISWGCLQDRTDGQVHNFLVIGEIVSCERYLPDQQSAAPSYHH